MTQERMNRGVRSLLRQLRTDAGSKTLGELLQEREAAACEIERLVEQLDELTPALYAQHPRTKTPTTSEPRKGKNQLDWRSRALLRLKDVCEIIGTSRSTVYKAMSEGTFPRSVRIGEKAVRWRSADIATWLDARGVE